MQHISFYLAGTLNSGYRGPLSFQGHPNEPLQGGDDSAASSSSLQQKLGITLGLCFILTGLPKDNIFAILPPIACWQDHFNGKALTVCYVSCANRTSSLLAKDCTRHNRLRHYPAIPIDRWPYWSFRLSFDSLNTWLYGCSCFGLGFHH